MTTVVETPIYCDVQRRHDFVLLFDVSDGNPNGDPDAGNLPRVDPETMQGLVTDVCIKRKVRDWVDLSHGGEERYKIYVQSGVALNAQHRLAYTSLKLTTTGTRQERGDVDQARAWMCANFYDIRLFGAVMTTGVNCGQVRGPVQLTFARSIDPVVPQDISITRIAVTKEDDLNVTVSEEDGQGTGGKRTEMGRKAFVPYGLYRAHGFFNPHLAGQTGVTDDDLALFWDALRKAWDADRSASRGLMACRGLYVFSHESALGNAPAHRLFESVRVAPVEPGRPTRAFTDYTVTIAQDALPAGITLSELDC